MATLFFRIAYEFLSGHSLLARAVLLAALTLALNVPLTLMGGIVTDRQSHEEEAVKNMTAPKMDYFVAIDTKARMKKALEVQGIPHVILMDPDGIVRWEGFPLLDGFELTEKVVADILAKPAA